MLRVTEQPINLLSLKYIHIKNKNKILNLKTEFYWKSEPWTLVSLISQRAFKDSSKNMAHLLKINIP